MCCYKTLQHNEFGYVVRCNKCDHLHVAFGNTLLAFSQEEYRAFLKSVEKCYTFNKYNMNPKAKIIQLPTVARSIMLVYSVEDLQNLLSLLDNAQKKLNNEQLFKFSDN